MVDDNGSKEPTPWPKPDERGLIILADIHFDRGAVQALETEYTPDEIIEGLAKTDVHAWVRSINSTHLERRGIGRLTIAGSSDHPVVSGRRFTDRERRGRGNR
jgi:hypothetical protein